METASAMEVHEDLVRIITVAPKGRLDALHAPGFRTQIQQLIDEGVRNLVIDLSQTPFLDSAGMAVLVSALKQCREHGGDARMVWPSADPVKRILALTKFDRVFDMKNSVAEAVASFSHATAA